MVSLNFSDFLFVFNFPLKIYAADVNYDVKVSGVEITPDPVVRARPVTFKISAATGKPYLLYLYFILFSFPPQIRFFFHAGTKCFMLTNCTYIYNPVW